ncbi:uncharacterized protein LOC100367404 [Saccoglossus kowalevskii]|uniref:Uncharacterized protein LOC100367404 n=1 Tax=Saccoglossus kowalevskii TaxID=10224 RepID=A0ABM0GKU3_SACKO|nr:PREDICTED: uncharacterized protein LOC100367404 [Saccoglossus kowalevskii]
MASCFALLSLFLVCDVVNVVVTADDFDFQWEQCGGNSIEFIELSITPMPIRSIQDINIAFNVEADQLGSDLKLDISIKRVVDLGWFGNVRVPVPCVFDVGSCEYNMCDLIETRIGHVCPAGDNGVCSCIDKTGYFTDEIKISLGDPSIVVSVLGSGNYEAKFTLTQGNGAVEACVKTKFSLDL